MVRLFKLDGLYTNWDMTKYSIKKIHTFNSKGETDEYFNYKEGIVHKFPGYELDNNSIVMNISDKTIDLNQHCKMFMSKEIELYQSHLKKEVFE